MSVSSLGCGSYSDVNWGLRLDCPDARLYTIKVQYPDPRLPHLTQHIKDEITVGRSQRFFVGKELVRRNAGKIQRDKYYLVSLYAGISLTEWLEQKQAPSASDRIQVAIQVCLQIQALHARNYAHRDLKLDNIFIDPITLKVTLGDYGLATPNATKKPDFLGTLLNLPIPLSINAPTEAIKKDVHRTMLRMGIINIDTFALKRVLSMPQFPNLPRKTPPPSLLPNEALTALADLIDTATINPPHGTPLEIAARLILFLYRQPTPVIFSAETQQTIANIYLNPDIKTDEVKKTIISRYLDEFSPRSDSALPPSFTNPSTNDLSICDGSPFSDASATRLSRLSP